MASLLDMTDVPLKNILENSDYKSVLTLRKVCHSLRNFIDDSCFKTDLDYIRITIGPTGFSVICRSPNALTDGIGFAKGWTSKDLKIILKLVQKSKLSHLYVETNPDRIGVLNDFEDVLKNLTRPLQTEHLAMKGSEILKVLPYLDSNLLKRILINPEYYQTNNQNLVGIEKMMELEQFKNAMELHIGYRFLVRADFRKFLHFQRVHVKFYDTSLEELVALKEAFVTSTHMVLFEFKNRGLDGNQLEQVFGTPFHGPHYHLGRLQWYFGIRNCKEHVLRIESISGFALKFLKLEVERIPDNAVVQH
ncbi:hypothetical protein CAEBREN_12581 [Caenorhabditis brenneri]|uniref:F-box domain-containing protein n=1 Tax=Caenorhabditis brenneri TaxID=135651 RepID=G0N1M4_CAEBE|nr:hypothetical protein CAEBREN_12581 [Caenorhabditis brenneri]